MIISHELKVIFIKTKKVGGTSFEIALSKYCGSDCVITPISPNDESTRASLGYRGAQNYQKRSWTWLGRRPVKQFYNHIPAAQVKRLIPEDVWRNYRKLTIFRNPYDAIISRYYWDAADRKGVPFDEFVRRNPALLLENTSIAPLAGDARLDHYLRYEQLKPDLEHIGLGYLWDDFSKIKAKSNLRPSAGASVSDVYSRYPGLVKFIAEKSAEEIAFFNHAIPG